MLWVLIRIALTRRGDSNQYPQHICLQRTKNSILHLSQKKTLLICSTEKKVFAPMNGYIPNNKPKTLEMVCCSKHSKLNIHGMELT